jgi:hypothetical protein
LHRWNIRLDTKNKGKDTGCLRNVTHFVLG